MATGGDPSSKVVVSFTCQRCQCPIILDHSFNSIDEHTLAELHRKIYYYVRNVMLEKTVL